LFVWLALLVAAAKMPLEEAALGTGTQQNLSNLLFFRYLWYYTTAFGVTKFITINDMILVTLCWATYVGLRDGFVVHLSELSSTTKYDQIHIPGIL
jgi:hypothetical protein